MRSILAGCALVSLAALGAAPLAAAEARRPDLDRSHEVRSPRVAPPARTPGTAVSYDDRWGVPNLLRLPPGTLRVPLDRGGAAAATEALRRIAPHYGLTAEALAATEVRGVHERRNGVRLAVVGQRRGGFEVFGQELKLLFAADGSLVAAGGTLVPRFVDGAGGPNARLGARAAIGAAERDLGLATDAGRDWRARPREDRFGRHYELAGADGAVVGRGRVGRIWFPLGLHLVPAWRVELLLDEPAGTGGGGWLHVVADDDGRVLLRRDLVQSDAFQYRVWASPVAPHTPADSPLTDFSPHPTGEPDASVGTPVAPILVTMEGFNTNPSLGVDPWLPSGATQTQGNNVDAYTDDNSPDGFSAGDLRATTTAAGVFDRTYDLDLGPLVSDNQKRAAVTQLFFTNNWLHDYWYDSGFDEAAGNAQQDNFGRGGLGGDRLQAQAQDAAGAGERDNANMLTPADGIPPRMQMYLWNESVDAALTATPGGGYTVGWALFGDFDFDVTGQVVVAVDGTPPAADACQNLTIDATNKIVLVDRGTCDFTDKVQNAQEVGAIGVLVADNVAGFVPPTLGGSAPGITVGTLSLTQADGAELKAAIGDGAVTATMERTDGVERSGELDGMLVAHEWGHYLHHRLASCGSQQCSGQSEGWGDFVALHTVIEDADETALGVYGAVPYATLGLRVAAPYFGIRRYPYSRDQAKSPLEFRHISNGQALPAGVPVNLDFSSPDNSAVHNVGEVWASMMLDAYGALIDLHDGETARRRMADYVVLGLQLAPADATFTEQRDALLAAAAASDLDDAAAMGQAFSLRGAGPCAVSPARASTTLTGVVEDFTTTKGTLEIVGVELDDDVASCDADGVLDAGESGTLRVQLRNTSAGDLPGFTLEATSSSADVALAGGGTLVGPAVPAFSTVEVEIGATADAGLASSTLLHVDLEVSGAALCAAAGGDFDAFVDIDAVPSASDPFSIADGGWTLTGAPAGLWTRIVDPANPANFIYSGADSSGITDIQLVSPPIQVSASPFTFAFARSHQFERSQGKNYDGGVVELSTDGGATWQDVDTLAAPSYNGTIFVGAGNPLSGRDAYTGTLQGWPARQTETLAFGTALAGETVRFRFRLGTDEATGSGGWRIDDVAVTGAVTNPFLGATGEAGVCTAVEIFADGFESGDTSAWSAVKPL